MFIFLFFPVTETTQASLRVNIEEFVENSTKVEIEVEILINIEMHQYKNSNINNVIIVHCCLGVWRDPYPTRGDETRFTKTRGDF